jgi:hypothetical protein
MWPYSEINMSALFIASSLCVLAALLARPVLVIAKAVAKDRP